MNCPNCGAQTQGAFCEYCGGELPKEQVNVGVCPKCGNSNISFKRERVGTTTQRTSRKNVIGTGRTGQYSSHTTYRTVGLCQNCGHTWSPEAGGGTSGRKTWLWVLGWIFIFPVPLTILLLRKKDMKPAVKYGIIAAAWALYLVIGLSGSSENTTPPDAPAYSGVEQSETTGSPEAETGTAEATGENNSINPYAKQEKNIREFVSAFNEISDTPVTDIDFIKNHTIAYLVVDGFSELSIKVNDHSEMGFFFTFEFSNGTASLGKYEDLMEDMIKVFDKNVDVGEKFQEAHANEDTTINLSGSISVEYHYIKYDVGFQAADTYIITLTSPEYHK